MNGLDYFKHVLFNNYVNFNGRARRSEYWFYILFYVVGSFILSFFMGLMSDISPVLGIGFIFLILLYYMLMFLPTLAVSVRRLHDTDKSGWFILLGLIPVVGFILLIIFYATEGTPGRNQYGVNPKEEDQSEIDIEDQLV